jgi:uncharacterized protein YkwD
MKRRLFPIQLLLSIAFLAIVSSNRAGAQPASGSDYCSGLEREVFSLVNQYRKTSDLPLLQWDDGIAHVARLHSRDMATGEVDFGHDGFSERVATIKTAMTGLCGAGENVLSTDQPGEVARMAVALWLRSPHHLENIRGDYNYSGLGVWQDKAGMIFFTQIFVKVPPQTHQAQAAPSVQLVAPFGLLAVPKARPGP